jgi:competence protein ComEC
MIWLFYGGGRVKRRMPAWLAGVVVLLVVVYTIFTGASPSVVRAAIMGSVLVLGPVLGRRYDPTAALAVSAAIMVIFDPNLLADVGFQFSFLAMLGIALLSPRLLPLFGKARLPGVLAYPLAGGLGATLGTLPVVTLLTGQLSLVAPFATLTADFALPPLMIAGIITIIVGMSVAGGGSTVAALPGLLVWPSAWWLVTNAQAWSMLPWAAIDVSGVSIVHVVAYYLLLYLGVLALPNLRRVAGMVQLKRIRAGALAWLCWR